jgi:hypothetical protein
LCVVSFHLWTQLAATWIIGILSSDGSQPSVPESIRIAFHSFSDIRVAGSYTTPERGQVPTGGTPPPSDAPQFNFTEWWKTGEGETTRPFDVRDELIPKLLLASEKV